MPPAPDLLSRLRQHRTLLIVMAIGLLLVEVQIFAVAATKSGRKSWLQVYDAAGTVVYETDGKRLSDFNKYYFEKNFGPLENYQVRLHSRDVAFPFRGWLVAALGLPLGMILLAAFVVKAFAALAYGSERSSANGTAATPGGWLDVVDRISQWNIFTIGAAALIAVLAYWIIPDAVSLMGRVGIETILRFKWFFLAAALLVAGLAAWIIYLRYLLAQKTIDSQAEVEKFRLQLQYGRQAPPAIGCLSVDPVKALPVAGGCEKAEGSKALVSDRSEGSDLSDRSDLSDLSNRSDAKDNPLHLKT